MIAINLINSVLGVAFVAVWALIGLCCARQ